MKVSIITVSYNAARTIERTIRSVLSQSYNNVEYIIIDGNSNDGTQNIVKKYEKEIACFISEPDRGLYDAMNKGLARATGDIVGIINSDDRYFDNEVVEKIVRLYESNRNSIFHGKILYHNLDGGTVELYPSKYMRVMKWQPAVLHPTMFVPLSLYKEYGVFDTSYKIAADYDLMLRFYLKGISFHFVDVLMVEMYAGGASDGNRNAGYYECYQICRKNNLGILSSMYHFLRRWLSSNIFVFLK